jgi:hypothetical protein
VIISHSHRFIFIKSRKTGGTSVEAALSQYCKGEDVVTPLGDYAHNRDEKGAIVHQGPLNAEGWHQHDDALSIKGKLAPELWSHYFKFSIARNPWDKVVSDFHWKRRQDPGLRPPKRFYHRLGIPSGELGEIRKLFIAYVKEGDWTNNDRFYTIGDSLCVDFVMRYERLSEDFEEVCRRFNVQVAALPHLKGGLRSGAHHYWEYYTPETIAIVAARHRNDLDLLGYRFERP